MTMDLPLLRALGFAAFCVLVVIAVDLFCKWEGSRQGKGEEDKPKPEQKPPDKTMTLVT
jgi:hypothetical protein